MNRKKLLLSALAALILIALVVITSEYPFNWSVPASITGTWKGKQIIHVRFKDGILNQSLRASSDSLPVELQVNPDGNVSGIIGQGVIKDCKVKRNRGWLYRSLKIASDYRIEGKLEGIIYPEDTITLKSFAIPFNLSNGSLRGELLQLQSGGKFLMAPIILSKQ